MNKIIGYVVSVIGLFLLAYSSFAPVRKVVPIPGLDKISPLIITIIGLAAIAVGIFLVVKSSSSSQKSEVPIYEGEKIVGYRRHKR